MMFRRRNLMRRVILLIKAHIHLVRVAEAVTSQRALWLPEKYQFLDVGVLKMALSELD